MWIKELYPISSATMEWIRSDDEDRASGLGACTLRRRAWLGVKMPPPFSLVVAPVVLAMIKKKHYTCHLPTRTRAHPHTHPTHVREWSQAAWVRAPSSDGCVTSDG